MEPVQEPQPSTSRQGEDIYDSTDSSDSDVFTVHNEASAKVPIKSPDVSSSKGPHLYPASKRTDNNIFKLVTFY